MKKLGAFAKRPQTDQFPSRQGNEVVMLVNGKAIFPAMLAAIRSATQSICLETYIYWDGDMGREFAEALAERARNGCDVRVTLDWLGCYPLSDDLKNEMSDAGVRIHHFRPLHWYSLRRFNHRSHRKILVVDGAVGFIGGVGIADSWRGDSQDEDHWRDNHYQVRGPVVADLQRVFLAHWKEDDAPVAEDPRFFPALPRAGDCTARMIAADPCDGPTRVRDAYLGLLAQARNHIAVITPYFMPGDRLFRALHDARSRGVAVQVLTCGQKTDRSVVRWASRHRWGDLLEDHIRINEFEPTLLHCKALLIDDRITLVGSANFDCRSCRINAEANLLIDDPTVTARHWDQFSQDLSRSQPVTWQDWERRGTKEKIVDQLSHLLRAQL